jgi:hypothetical protein
VLPATIDALTPEWLSKALGLPVRSYRAETFGTGVGMIGQLARVFLDYESGGIGPTSVIVKLPTNVPANRGLADWLRLYEREARFYSDVADNCGVRVPRPYHVTCEPETQQFALVLEDLAGSRVIDQLQGVSLDDARTALSTLARLHAAWWDHPQLGEMTWMPDVNDPTVTSLDDFYESMWEPFLARCGDWLTAEERKLGDRVRGRITELTHRADGKPLTITHGDFRSDNLFFDLADGSPCALVDWQISLRVHSGMNDVVYFLGGSCDRKMAKKQGEELTRHYYDELCRAGVTEFPWDDAVDMAKAGALTSLIYAVAGGADIDMGNERGERLLEQIVSGYYGIAMDLDAGSIL